MFQCNSPARKEKASFIKTGNKVRYHFKGFVFLALPRYNFLLIFNVRIISYSCDAPGF